MSRALQKSSEDYSGESLHEHYFGHQHVTVIEPPRGWRLPDLKELWAYRELFLVLTVRDIKVDWLIESLGLRGKKLSGARDALSAALETKETEPPPAVEKNEHVAPGRYHHLKRVMDAIAAICHSCSRACSGTRGPARSYRPRSQLYSPFT